MIVSPAGESVLIDAGSAGERDAARIVAAAQELGLQRIDHLVVTHFHSDHFGGVPDLAAKLPVGTIYEHDRASIPDNEKGDKARIRYDEFKGPTRKRIVPGMALPLRQTPGAQKLIIRFLGTEKQFGPPVGKANPACAAKIEKPADTTDNQNSVVTLVTYGGFRFFDGGDLTWNTEAALVCPRNRVGTVDLLQSNHHGVDISNNPVLVSALDPTVAVVNNGARKGGESGTLATLKKLPNLQGLYQVHRNVRLPDTENAAADHIANKDETCAGAPVAASVAIDGKSYTLTVPSTGHSASYKIRKH